MMFSKLKQSVIVLAAVLASGVAMANHNSGPGHRHGHHHSGGGFRPISPYFAVGYGFGGDEIGSFEDSNGDVEKIRAGGGGHIDGGVIAALDPWTSVRFTGGYKATSVSRVNGDTTFERVQFGITALRTHGFHEFGLGLTFHTGVRYDCNIDTFCAGDVDFESALGYTVEYAIKPVPHGRHGVYGRNGLRLGVRYTGIEYTPELAGAEVLNGNSLGGFIGISF